MCLHSASYDVTNSQLKMTIESWNSSVGKSSSRSWEGTAKFNQSLSLWDHLRICSSQYAVYIFTQNTHPQLYSNSRSVYVLFTVNYMLTDCLIMESMNLIIQLLIFMPGKLLSWVMYFLLWILNVDVISFTTLMSLTDIKQYSKRRCSKQDIKDFSVLIIKITTLFSMWK